MSHAAMTERMKSARAERRAARGGVHLIGLGCAVPPRSRAQADVAAELAELWTLKGAARNRWDRINAGSGIEQRHGVVPVSEIVGLSTGDRMRLYEEHAPDLAAEAARGALESATVDPRCVTDLIVVSCTGFSAPGLDAALIERLGLPPTTRRSIVGFMGCFGAISGLRAAVGACSADPGAVTLVVCCELCSLHVPPRPSVHDLVASALFGDGAAAAVAAGAEAGDAVARALRARRSLGRLTVGRTRLLPDGDEWMTWRITDAGFAMTLEKAVPAALREALPAFVDEACDRPPRSFIVHPGGPGILQAVDKALSLEGGRGIEASWEVLRRCGNMSSATLLFVMDALWRERAMDRPALLLAFGPGLTIESIVLDAAIG